MPITREGGEGTYFDLTRSSCTSCQEVEHFSKVVRPECLFIKISYSGG